MATLIDNEKLYTQFSISSHSAELNSIWHFADDDDDLGLLPVHESFTLTKKELLEGIKNGEYNEKEIKNINLILK